jgi:transposase-like protein
VRRGDEGGARRLFTWRQGHSSPQPAFDLANEVAALTHGHPTGVLASGALAVLVQALLDDSPLPAAITTAKACLRKVDWHEETLKALEHAEQLAAANVPHDEAVAALGKGWVAEEALAISVYCALVARDLEHGIIMAVNHDGDSDSTGAIAGNLLGAMHGVDTTRGAGSSHWNSRTYLVRSPKISMLLRIVRSANFVPIPRRADESGRSIRDRSGGKPPIPRAISRASSKIHLSRIHFLPNHQYRIAKNLANYILRRLREAIGTTVQMLTISKRQRTTGLTHTHQSLPALTKSAGWFGPKISDHLVKRDNAFRRWDMARRKRFSAEFKRQALRRANEPGMTDALLCEELGVSTRQLRRWKDAIQEHGEDDAFPGHGKARDNEVAKLRRELKKVTEERDFLREAARYFAKESK